PGHPDVEPSAPVARDVAQRREPDVAAVGADADAVDPGAAGDRDAPAALRARAQHREGVVADPEPRRPATLGEDRLQPLLLFREIDAREQDLRDIRPAAVEARPVDELLEDVDAAVQPEVMRRAERP